MELVEGGSLYVLMDSPDFKYSRYLAMSWCTQCADAVAYLHSMTPKPLVHRDLKSENVLANADGSIVKICDFGTVTEKRTNMTVDRGSAPWMAPEVMESGSKYTELCDVYSWGIFLWECLSREVPYKDLDSGEAIMYNVKKHGKRPNPIAGLPKRIETLMTECWDALPENRPTMKEVHARMKELSKLFPEIEEPIVNPERGRKGVDARIAAEYRRFEKRTSREVKRIVKKLF